jgi:outer membrane protein OmpA-like peptidoglycan-associated protein
LLGIARPANAQSSYFYLDRAQLSGAPDDGFMVFRPYMSKQTRFYGTAALGYSHNPLRSETVTSNPVAADLIDNPMQGQLILYSMAGVQLMSRVGASISLPLSVINITGTDPQRAGVGSGGMDDVSTAFHDLRLDLRVRSFETDDGKSRFGGGFAVWAPTGNGTGFAGDDQVSGWLFGSAEFDLKRFFVAGHIGPHFRPDGSIGGPNGALFLSSELRWAFGMYMPLREGKIRLGGELYGTTGLDSAAGSREVNTIFSGRNTALEWLGQVRFLLEQDPSVYVNAGLGTRLSTGYGAPDFRLLVSIGKYFQLRDKEGKSPPRKVKIVSSPDDYDVDTDGDGYPDAIDKCPSIKEDRQEPDTSDGCPGGSDRDSDGIPDQEDACPDKAEDKDGVEDRDGCPEQDADNDGILDQQDKCPTEAGLGSEIAEKHGCPGLTRFKEGDGDVELLTPIEFEFGKAVLKASSYPILDEVVALMKSRASLRIGVYGHTDSHGALALNLRLSRERAAACMKYIVDKGIAASRLESDGFGPNKPIADNDTAEGRSRNRRVEFKVLGGGG